MALTYPSTHLGAGPDTLSAIASGHHAFAETLKAAKKPLIIVGQGAFAREDGLAVLALAAQIAARRSATARTRPGTASTCCIRRRRASRASISASFRARADAIGTGHSAIRICRSSICSVPTSAISAELGDRLRRSIRAATAIAGAHARRRDPAGAAYTEKSVTYVNTEGRAQQTVKAAFAPGEAKEDWAIIRALSARAGSDAAL